MCRSRSAWAGATSEVYWEQLVQNTIPTHHFPKNATGSRHPTRHVEEPPTLQQLQQNRSDTTKQSESYATIFASCPCTSFEDRSDPLVVGELLIGESDGSEPLESGAEAVRQVFKRRRLQGKQAPVPREHGSDVSITWEGIFQECNESVPRVGRKFYNAGDPLVENIQRLIQPFTVKHVVLCRGTDRVFASCYSGKEQSE